MKSEVASVSVSQKDECVAVTLCIETDKPILLMKRIEELNKFHIRRTETGRENYYVYYVFFKYDELPKIDELGIRVNEIIENMNEETERIDKQLVQYQKHLNDIFGLGD